MNTPNEEQKPADNMELLKQQASSCGAECDCHAGGPMAKSRLILGTIVLLVAVVLVARAVIKSNEAPSRPETAAFAPLAPATADSQFPAIPSATAEATAESVSRSIASLSDLNTLAAANDAVFVYVPGKDGAPGNSSAAAMKSAVGRIGAQGYKIGVFTLEAGSRDHEQLTAQMSVPGVLAMVKGRGTSAVSGDITETKLIQGFVAASSAGGCGPGGCGPAGCGPTGSK